MQDVQALLQRPRLYDNVDGSSELMLGSMLVGFTAYQWIGYHAHRESFWNSVYSLYLFVALMIAALIYGRKALKSSVTYRRTGFVSYQKPHLWWLLLIVFLAAAVGGGFVFLLAQKHGMNSTSLVMIGMGIFISAAYAYGIARQAHWKWIVAALLTISPFVIALLPEQLASKPIAQSGLSSVFDPRLLGSLFWCNSAYGVVLLISGCISLAAYLHGTHKVEME